MLFLGFLFLGACSSVQSDEEVVSGPEWLQSPPVSEDCIYGLGCADDEFNAKQLALVSAAQQFSTHIKSSLLLCESNELGGTGDVLHTFDEQITDHTIRGAKFIDRYTDENGRIWILAEAPLKCLLDGTENMLISYMVYTEKGIPGETDTVEEIRERRRAVRAETKDRMNEILDEKKLTEQVASTGYIEPGFVIGYSANNSYKGTPPVDRRLYCSDEYAYVLGNPGGMRTNDGLFLCWTSEPDGTGALYQEGSFIRMGDRDLTLYAQFSGDALNVKDVFVNRRIKPQKRTIKIDGKMDDWAELHSVRTDNTGDCKIEADDDIDISAVYFAIDEDYLYFMVRTVSGALPGNGYSYAFNLYNETDDNIMFFDLFYENNTSKYASYKADFWPPNSKPTTEWQAMYSAMRVRAKDVLEVAIPLKVLKSSPFYRSLLKFYFVTRERRTQTDIDDIEHIYIDFPE